MNEEPKTQAAEPLHPEPLVNEDQRTPNEEPGDPPLPGKPEPKNGAGEGKRSRNRKAERMLKTVLEMIQSGKEARRQIQAGLDANPEPPLEMLMRLVRVILLNHAQSMVKDAASFQRAVSLLKFSVEWEKIVEARRRSALAERKHAEGMEFKRQALEDPYPPVTAEVVDGLLEQLVLPDILPAPADLEPPCNTSSPIN